MKDVPPGNIMNYDETNLCDSPGRKKVISKRGLKLLECVMNSSKSATSIVYAGCTDESLLLPYVGYEATNLYNMHTFGGPQGARYNCSKCGWFDLRCFEDWFMSVALLYLKTLWGKKVLIGAICLHLSAEIIQKCEENQIAFFFDVPLCTEEI